MNDAPVNPEPLTPQQQAVLKWSKRAIVVMTVLIFLGLVVIGSVLVKRSFAKPEVAAREEAIRILLPYGSLGNVHAVSLQENRLTFAVDSGQGSAIYVMDIATGKMISEIQLVRQGAPVAMR